MKARSTKAGASAPATLLETVSGFIGVHRSTKAGASAPATRRHEIQPHACRQRSTKAGTSAPATRGQSAASRDNHASLNEGRGISPGDTESLCFNAITNPSLNEGRGISPGDTLQNHQESPRWCGAQRRPGHQPRRHFLKLSVASSECIAQRRPGHQPRRHHYGERRGVPVGWPLNEGRGISPGDTVGCGQIPSRASGRSTKAGASAPATQWAAVKSHPAPAAAQRRPGHQPRRHGESVKARPVVLHALNEGRGISPGDTAKFCKRAVPRRTSALPRMREPRRRRVCGHFTRFRTIPRQNGRDQAVETASTAAKHTRFPRITEGSQMSQSTQGCPSS